MSADGSVIVGSGVSDDGAQAFRWTEATGMVGLGVPAGWYSMSAESVSGDGSIIVGEALGGDYRAFIWDESHGWRNLNDVLKNDYGLVAVMSGWTLTKAISISADGKTIVGEGYDPNGNDSAWIAHLVPEQSSFVLAVVGAIGIILRSRRCGSKS